MANKLYRTSILDSNGVRQYLRKGDHWWSEDIDAAFLHHSKSPIKVKIKNLSGCYWLRDADPETILIEEVEIKPVKTMTYKEFLEES